MPLLTERHRALWDALSIAAEVANATPPETEVDVPDPDAVFGRLRERYVDARLDELTEPAFRQAVDEFAYYVTVAVRWRQVEELRRRARQARSDARHRERWGWA